MKKDKIDLNPLVDDTPQDVAVDRDLEVAQQEELADVALPEEVAIAPDPALEQPFILHVWKGLPQWQCRFCSWDTLDSEETMMEHYIIRHAPPPVFGAQNIVWEDLEEKWQHV